MERRLVGFLVDYLMGYLMAYLKDVLALLQSHYIEHADKKVVRIGCVRLSSGTHMCTYPLTIVYWMQCMFRHP